MGNQFTHDVFISFSFKDQQIVDTIVNQLMNRYQIPCWICTAEIRGGDDYYTDIMEAISASKVLVFVQTKNSVESKEIPDEIYSAIAEGKTIISFVVEESELKGGMKLKLRGRQFIDARKPELDDRIRELAKELCMLLGRPFCEGNTVITAASGERLLSTPSVIPKKVFCGRDDVLEEIHERFSEDEHVLFLYGIGGIGKTQIAKQYAKRYKKNYDTVVYATYGGDLKTLLLADMPFSIEPQMTRYTLSDGTREDDEAFFVRKLEKIKKIANERTLIIIDNFDVEDDACLPALTDGKYHLLITTRCDYSRYYPTVTVRPIDSVEHLKSIFLQNYDGDEVEEDDPDLVTLIEMVNRHTYTIELLAQHMEKSGQTAEEMIEALKQEGILSLNEKVQNSDMKTQIAYENLLKMFKLFSLEEEERQVLMYLSLMPIEGVNVREFKTWAGLKSSRVIKNLESRSWIVKNTEGIALHPIIREVIRHEIPADEENCREFLEKFTETIVETQTWRLKKTDKDRLAMIAKYLLAKFDSITERTEALYYHSEVLLSFAVDPSYAAELAQKLYAYYERTVGENAFETARAAFKWGWVYTYNSQLPNATQNSYRYLAKAEEIFKQLELTSKYQIAMYTQTIVNLAKIHIVLYEQTGDPEMYVRAKEYAELSLKKTTETFVLGDFHYSKIAGAHWQLADVLISGERFEEALIHIDEALALLKSLYSENNGDFMGALHRKAVILYGLSRYLESKELVVKSAVGYAEYFGSKHPRVCEIYMLWGDCCVSLGEHAEALTAYRKAEEIAEMIYAPDARQLVQIKEKIASCSEEN